MKYSNQKTGLQVYAGKIRSVAEDRLSVVLNTNVYNTASKKYEYVDLTVTSSYPLAESFKAGGMATAVGYQNGQNQILAQHIASNEKAATFESTDLAVISGTVGFARFNEEKTQDGSANLKKDGTPKKPHFDIRIDVAEGDKIVHHTVKVYELKSNFTNDDGTEKKSLIEKAKAAFKNFEDSEKTPMYVSIVTQPGQERVWERTDENGQTKIDYFVDHMGYRGSIDVIPMFKKEKEAVKATEETKTAETIAKEATASVDAIAAETAKNAEALTSTQTVGGQGAPVEDIDDIPFA